MAEMGTVCCFTGHRKISPEHAKALKSELDRALEILVRSGVRTFRAGGAIGFDTLAALTVLDMRENDPSIRLELCLPCKDQDRLWSDEDRKIYRYVLERADKVTYVCENYTRSCMLERNRFMVDGSQFCVAFCLDPNRQRGGTAYTVRYAKSKNVPVIDLGLKVKLLTEYEN